MVHLLDIEIKPCWLSLHSIYHNDNNTPLFFKEYSVK